MVGFAPLKPVIWIASTRRDFRVLPAAVKSHMGYALFVAQEGGIHRDAKPLKGFGGAGVVEIVKDHRGDTFRTIYTVRFARAVYVLHVFQKKSKSGRTTPSFEMDVVRWRLREAERIEQGERS